MALPRMFSQVLMLALTHFALAGAEAHSVPDAGTGEEASVHPFWVFHWEEVMKPEVPFCCFTLLLAGALCAAAGIGGGGVYVAVLMSVGQLTPHNAVPLSKAIVLLGSVASLLVNMRRVKGLSKAPVLNLDTCRIIVPAALVGTFLGVLLNWRTKDSTIVVLLTALLVFMTCMVLRTAWLQHFEELQHDAAAPAQTASCCQGWAYNPQDDPPEAGSIASSEEEASLSQEMEAERWPLLGHGASTAIELVERHRTQCWRNVPSRTDLILAGWLMLVVVLSGVLRFHMHACREDVKEGNSKASCQHPVAATLFGGRLEFWMKTESTSVILQLIALSVPLWSCCSIAVYYGYIVRRVANWKAVHVIAYQVVALGTGLLAGLVGVGGGLILSPFFLLTGMEPAVAVGTSSTCVLFTSASTTFQYAFTDRIIMSLALVYGMVTLLASYAGTSLVHMVQDRFAGRRSYVTLFVAVGVALSAVLATVKLAGQLKAH